jgi:Recombination endonuclease VII
VTVSPSRYIGCAMAEAKRPKGFCKDCWEDPRRFLRKERPAPHPGPRCFTHHLAFKKARKAKTQVNRDAKVYGLAEGGYEALLEIQGGACALCRSSKGISKRMPVDHDHATGMVRGICCSNCNRNVLGWFAKDDPEAFQRGKDYLLDPPASRLDAKYILPKGDPGA